MRGEAEEAGTEEAGAGAGAVGAGAGALALPLIGRDITTLITAGITTLITGILTHIGTITPIRVAAGRPGLPSISEVPNSKGLPLEMAGAYAALPFFCSCDVEGELAPIIRGREAAGSIRQVLSEVV